MPRPITSESGRLVAAGERKQMGADIVRRLMGTKKALYAVIANIPQTRMAPQTKTSPAAITKLMLEPKQRRDAQPSLPSTKSRTYFCSPDRLAGVLSIFVVSGTCFGKNASFTPIERPIAKATSQKSQLVRSRS